MHTLVRIAAMAGTVLLAACATSPETPAGLANTRWTLVAFAPSSTPAAEVRPADSQRYRLDFQADGRLLAQVDCNRGSGTWQATPQTGQSGTLKLGPLALTRMMCPPDAIGQHWPQDVERIAGYRLVDGRLLLTVAASGGSYTWERAQP